MRREIERSRAPELSCQSVVRRRQGARGGGRAVSIAFKAPPVTDSEPRLRSFLCNKVRRISDLKHDLLRGDKTTGESERDRGIWWSIRPPGSTPLHKMTRIPYHIRLPFMLSLGTGFVQTLKQSLPQSRHEPPSELLVEAAGLVSGVPQQGYSADRSPHCLR